MGFMHPGVMSGVARGSFLGSPRGDGEGLPWSDHSGLRCSFGLGGLVGSPDARY